MTHSELVKAAQKWLLKTQSCSFALAELVTYLPEIPDAIGFSHQRSILVECKASRADFLADKKKYFRRIPQEGLGDFRYFMVEDGLIKPEEVPQKWGLIYVKNGRCNVKVKAEYLGGNLKSERMLLTSALRRVHLRGDLEKIYDVKTLNG